MPIDLQTPEFLMVVYYAFAQCAAGSLAFQKAKTGVVLCLWGNDTIRRYTVRLVLGVNHQYSTTVQ